MQETTTSTLCARLTVSVLVVTACCSGCLEPASRMLTHEEETQLHEQMEYTYSLPQDQQALAQRMVECNREFQEQKDWHTGDYLLDGFSDRKSKCEGLLPVKGSSAINDNTPAIDAIIDRNLKEALEKSKNE